MELTTERLLLREYAEEDLDNYFCLKSCAAVWRFSTFVPLLDRNDADKRLKDLIAMHKSNHSGFMALFIQQGQRFIGEAGIISENKKAGRCELGYNLLPEYWNRGYATEIAGRLVRYALDELGYERVEALVLAENKASCRVLEKNGFQCEGVLRHFSRYDGNFHNVCYYGIISSDLH